MPSSWILNARSIRHTRTGKIILLLKRDKTNKGTAHKCLAEEILADGNEVRALITKATLTVKNLVESKSMVQLSVVDTNKSVKIGKLKVGWSVMFARHTRATRDLLQVS